MTWVEIAAIVVLLLGVGAGGFLVAQRPAFWVGLGSVLIQKAFPYIAAYVTKRNTPEVEQQMADCVRRGGEWDNAKKRCR
jgi:hypothetical protein